MSAKQRTNWFWSDWLGAPEVRRLTPAERGVWIDLLALAAAANPTGYVVDEKGRPLTLEEIARVTNARSPDEAAELVRGILEKGAASSDRTGRIFSRRMVRDATIKDKRKKSAKFGGEATRLKWHSFSEFAYQNAYQAVGPPDPIRKKKPFSTSAREAADGKRLSEGKQVSESLEQTLRSKGWTNGG